jgi:hypothetical protein
MADPIYLFNAQVLNAVNEAREEFKDAVKAMGIRRSAAGSYLSGSMLQEVGTLASTSMAHVRTSAEAAFATVFHDSLWISDDEIARMLEAASKAMAEARDVGLAQLASLQRLQLPRGAHDLVAVEINRAFDANSDRLLLLSQIRKRSDHRSKVRRLLGLFGSLVRSIGRWVLGVFVRPG